MDIVYAAEKPSIARLLGKHMKRRFTPDEICVSENPDEAALELMKYNADTVLEEIGIDFKEFPEALDLLS